MNTDLIHLPQSHAFYPPTLAVHLGPKAPETLAVRGDPAILRRPAWALFCSQQCPGELILPTYDVAQKLRAAGVTVIGGFHSAMERECLRILLCSPHPVALCLARALPRRLPQDLRRPIAEGRLLLLSPFAATVHRADKETAYQRNRVVAALARHVFIAYAAPGSRTESFAREVVAWGKSLSTLNSAANANLIALGAGVIGERSPPWRVIEDAAAEGPPGDHGSPSG